MLFEKGDSLAIVAPSSPVEKGSLEKAVLYFRSHGFDLIESKHLYDSNRFLAGSDEVRANDLMTAFLDQNIKGIFTARGGYGSMRILDLLDYEVIKQNPKPLFGLSDSTALQLALYKKAGLCSYTGLSLAYDFKEGLLTPFLENEFWQIVNEEDRIFKLESLRTGDAEGPVIAGCLSLIVSLLGSDYCPGFTNAILIIEDVGEQPYRVDRMLYQLHLAGVFKKISALIFGQFRNCKSLDPADGAMSDVIDDCLNYCPCPVFHNFAYGHEMARHIIQIGALGKIHNTELAIKVNSIFVQ